MSVNKTFGTVVDLFLGFFKRLSASVVAGDHDVPGAISAAVSGGAE